MLDRQKAAEQIEKLLAQQITYQEIGWWAYDYLIDGPLMMEPGFEKLLEDFLWSFYYFHDEEPYMKQFCPDMDEILYYLKCLKGEEIYQRIKYIHWRV